MSAAEDRGPAPTPGAAGAPWSRSGLVVGILGPTGVGKSAVAMALAGRVGARIISCDSMQLYRGFPVLTNQPTDEELGRVPHELMGIVDPLEESSAAEYGERAQPLIDEDLSRHGVALLVGGTGLYMRAALAPLDVRPVADLGVRNELEARARTEGPEALHGELVRRDPAAAAAIDPRNVRRVVRALEAVTQTGAAWSGREDLWKPRYRHRTLLVALTMERDLLYRRIDERARSIVEGGAVEEVARFREIEAEAAAAGAPPKRVEAAAQPRRGGITTAIGYSDICGYLDGLQSLEDTVARVAAATRRYARRQLTWLRKLEGLVIIDVRDRSAEALADEIVTMMSSAEHVREPYQP